MKSNPAIEALRTQLAQIEKGGATIEQLQLFSRRIKAHSELEALVESHRPSKLVRWVNPTSVLLYTALIAALATLITSKIQQASYDNFFLSNIAQAVITSTKPPSEIASKLLLLREAEIIRISDAAKEELKTEAAKPK